MRQNRKARAVVVAAVLSAAALTAATAPAGAAGAEEARMKWNDITLKR